MENSFWQEGPLDLWIIVHKCDVSIMYIFQIVKHLSINRLQFVFVKDFIAPIRLSYFTTLNSIHLRKNMRELVGLKHCM